MKKSIHFLLLLIFSITVVNAQDWQALGPDDFKQASAGAVEYPNLVFNGNTPYLVFQDGANDNKATVRKLNADGKTWETVGNPGFSQGKANYTNIAFDGATPYVAYQDEANANKPTVMKLNSAGTAWEVVGTVGFSTGAATDIDIVCIGGIPYVCYLGDFSEFFKATVKKLNAAGTGWEVVGTPGFTPFFSSYLKMAVDNDIPYVVFSDGSKSGKITVMKFNETATSWETVGNAGFSAGSSYYTDIAFYGGEPYVVYQDYSDNDGKATVMKLNATGTGWEVVGTARFSASYATYTDIAFKGSVPYVVYQDGGNNYRTSVMKLNGAGSGWELVGTAGFSKTGTTSNCTIAFGNGVPYLAHRDGGKAGVMKLNAAETGWEVVGTKGFSIGEAYYPHLGFNANKPYVVYADQANSGKATVMKLNDARTDWDLVGNAGFTAGNVFSSIDIAFHGSTPYVVYSDAANSAKATVVKLDDAGASWEVVGMPGFSDAQAYDTKIVFNGNTPYVLYSDWGNGKKTTVMKLNALGVWEVVGTVGFSTGIADYINIAFDDNIPYVVYSNQGNNYKASVMKLNGAGTGWELVGVDGFSVAQSVNADIAFINHIPYVVYSDGGDGNKITLKRFVSGNWELVGKVPTNGPANNQVMVISEGKPYLVYTEAANGYKVKVQKFDGANWELMGNTDVSAGLASFPTIGTNGNELVVVYNSSGAFSKSFSLTTLPVKLTSFEASIRNQNQVSLTWQTASETENSYFTISKSADGKTFEQLTTVKSIGDNGASYSTIDFNPFAGITYYKLTQTDKDGKTEEMGARTVKLSSLKVEGLSVYPNPVSNGIINIKAEGLSGLQILEIYDLAGKKLASDNLAFVNGKADYKVAMFKKGVYILKVRDKKMKIIVE